MENWIYNLTVSTLLRILLFLCVHCTVHQGFYLRPFVLWFFTIILWPICSEECRLLTIHNMDEFPGRLWHAKVLWWSILDCSNGSIAKSLQFRPWAWFKPRWVEAVYRRQSKINDVYNGYWLPFLGIRSNAWSFIRGIFDFSWLIR